MDSLAPCTGSPRVPQPNASDRIIWPLVKQQIHERTLRSGWNAGKYLEKYLPQPDLTLVNNLTHPSEFFAKAVRAMVYAPSQGSGMKVKVMESMAYGVPVVTTWEGVEGIDYQNGQECWVAETDEELANKACHLLESPTERQQMRDAARALIEERYSPRPVVDKMVSVYQLVIASSKGRLHVSSLCI